MIIQARDRSIPFITKDGSEIRSLLDRTNAPVRHQSLAEATIPPATRTQPHYHKKSEEFYYVIEGEGSMTLGDVERPVAVGDAVLIPPGEIHTIANTSPATPLRILCCCSPPYSHEDTVLIEE